MKMENLVTDSSSSHFDLPHITSMFTIYKTVFDKVRVFQLILCHLLIKIISAYNSHNCMTTTMW